MLLLCLALPDADGPISAPDILRDTSIARQRSAHADWGRRPRATIFLFIGRGGSKRDIGNVALATPPPMHAVAC